MVSQANPSRAIGNILQELGSCSFLWPGISPSGNTFQGNHPQGADMQFLCRRFKQHYSQ